MLTWISLIKKRIDLLPCVIGTIKYSLKSLQILQTVITELVGEHQTCRMRGRAIQANTHVARSVLGLRKNDFRRVAMVQIDFEMAFGRVRHDVLFSVLSHVGF